MMKNHYMMKYQLILPVAKPDIFGNSKEYLWIRENAHNYGFIIRYQKGKEKITGYGAEEWHIRYVGKNAAEYIYKNNITFEEYYDLFIK